MMGDITHWKAIQLFICVLLKTVIYLLHTLQIQIWWPNFYVPHFYCVLHISWKLHKYINELKLIFILKKYFHVCSGREAQAY